MPQLFGKWPSVVIVCMPLAVALGKYIYKKMSNKPPLEAMQPVVDLEALTDDDAEEEVPGQEPGAGTAGVPEVSGLRAANNYKKKGNLCFYKGRYMEAMGFYNKAIDICPKQHTKELAIFYHNLAACHEMQANWTRVKEDCSKALAYNRLYAKAYFRRARAHEATMELEECLVDITATCILEECQNERSMKFRNRIKMQLASAKTKERMGAMKTTLPPKQHIRSYISSFMEDPLQKMTLPAADVADAPGRAFLRAHRAFTEERFEDVIPACNEVIESSEADGPYRLPALFLRGTLHMIAGSSKDCKEDFLAILSDVRVDNELRIYTQIRCAALVFNLKHKTEALEVLKEAEIMDPLNPDIYNHRALLLGLMERFNEALADFKTASRLAPSHAITQFNRHLTEYRIALKEGNVFRLKSAVDQLKQATERFPDCEEGLVMLSQVYAEERKFPEASKCLERAIELSPTNAELLCHRAVLAYEWHNDIDLVFPILEEAYNLDANCQLAYENLGMAELRRRNLNNAVNFFFWAYMKGQGFEEINRSFCLHSATVAEMKALELLGMTEQDISVDIRDIPNP